MENRWCESCDTKCESTFCIENNICSQIIGGTAGVFVDKHIDKAKIYNDYQLKIFKKELTES